MNDGDFVIYILISKSNDDVFTIYKLSMLNDREMTIYVYRSNDDVFTIVNDNDFDI